MNRIKHLVHLLLLFFLPQTHASDWQDNAAIARLFELAQVQGTFVLYDVAAQRFSGYNKPRADQRFIPASTFKIANTLIGLSVKAVSSVDEILPYVESDTDFETWKKDMSLREAIAISNVAIYRELARRIGLSRMRDNVLQLNYGNAQIGTVVDNFWLQGPLKISALEQTKFLANLAAQTLPYPLPFQKKVAEIIILEKTPHWVLYGKTGWENAPGPGIGWWVGWVTKDHRHYAFALNLDIKTPADAAKRIEIGRASLTALGIL